MIIIGHKNIPFAPLYRCCELSSISQTPSNSILLLGDDNTHILAEHCRSNNISFCVEVDSVKSLMIFSALNCTYLLVKDIEFAKQAQSIAQYYLFDSKILFVSSNDDDIELVANIGIDGILFKDLGVI